MCLGVSFVMPAIAISSSEAANQPAEDARPLGAFVKGQATRGAHRPKRSSNALGGATSKHKGVTFRPRNNRFLARLCVPGKKRKLDLGEYNSHEAAVCAYRVGAFYYDKPLDTVSEEAKVSLL